MTKSKTDSTTIDSSSSAPNVQVQVHAQYLKDLSFENPKSLMLNPQGPQPNISVNVDTTAQNVAENTYEVSLHIEVKAVQDEAPIFLIEITYAGILFIENVSDEQKEAILLIEGPRLLFPFARNIIADLARDGGFPPLLINPVDFATLYYSQK